ncbi:hypothetical protein BJ912DRAFT_898089 [Pholiota molesta]|nr:hypothetical protein BJ912DRAFT_898089 [Pholiota molesta]
MEVTSADSVNWFNPARNFAYSQGSPNGSSGLKTVTCALLTDEDGNEVPCKESHSTSCSFADRVKLAQSHTKASPEDISTQLKKTHLNHSATNTLQRQLFRKTLAFFYAIKQQGCTGPPPGSGFVQADHSKDTSAWQAQIHKGRRGRLPKDKCNGEICFRYASDRKPYLCCEHYSRRFDADHFIYFDITKGLYETRYLEALFFGDTEIISEYEEDAALCYDIGPLAFCSSVSNFSTIKVNCASEHRNTAGEPVIAEMVRMPCESRFRIFEPIEEYRIRCPRILVVCHGDHPHPIPIPTRTPHHIQKLLAQLLESIVSDLPDLTPRRFLQHPSTQSFLKNMFPKKSCPTLIDLHPSLANKDHLRVYILKAQATHFPEGTGWEGLLFMKNIQESSLPPDEIYIRRAIEVPNFDNTHYSASGATWALDDDEAEDLDPESDIGTPFRMVVCMLKESSFRIHSAQYLQSDIGFKRVIGFKEFELGGLDSESRTSITYCRIFVNRQTASAHCLIFDTIDDIVFEDTGRHLQWRHLHSPNLTNHVGILQFAVDQHGGQAKGLGMHLVRRAQEDPLQYDLHETNRLVKDLGIYDHLRRLLRLCIVHFYRNIRKTQVSDSVRNQMRSLVCIEHSDWDGTLMRIEAEGGKAGKDWLADKIRAKFALPGVCWEKSLIPLQIWKAGDSTTNIIECVHADVNREGISCTLCGGIEKGRFFDNLKLKTLLACFLESLHSRHITVSTARSLKRKADSQHKVLVSQDKTIELQNKRLKSAHTAKAVALERLLLHEAHAGPSTSGQQAQATRAFERAAQAYGKAVAESLANVGHGSGKVGILLPNDAAVRQVSPHKFQPHSRGSM